jgi:hypothetical protein
VLGLTEAGYITLISGTLSGLTLILVALIGALIGRGSRRRDVQAAEERAELKQAVAPENGHATLGSGLAAIEDRLIEGDARFDRIEVKLDEQNERLNEHIQEVSPLATYVRKQMKKGKK